MKKTLLALTTALACTGAFAESYIGLTAGHTTQEVECSGWAGCDKEDVGFKLYGGYKLSKHAAIELAYTDFGSVNLSGFGGSGYSAQALSTGGAFFLPFSPKLTGIARLGVAWVEADFDGFGGFGGGSESGLEPYVGLGLSYALTPKLSFTGSLDFMRASYPRGSGSARLLGLGLSLAF